MPCQHTVDWKPIAKLPELTYVKQYWVYDGEAIFQAYYWKLTVDSEDKNVPYERYGFCYEDLEHDYIQYYEYPGITHWAEIIYPEPPETP
jgi:hypothetical protein